MAEDRLKCVMVRIGSAWYYLTPLCVPTTNQTEAATFVDFPAACRFAEEYIDSPAMLDMIDQISLKLFPEVK